MTTLLDRPTKLDVLAARLASLQAQRREVQAEIAPTMSGDDADRATNIDGHVRLAMLDARITDVEVELAQADSAPRAAHDVVGVGDVVTVDFGDGPEDHLLASVDTAADGMDVITPGSPLGRALVGAQVGATVEWTAARRTHRLTVLATA